MCVNVSMRVLQNLKIALSFIMLLNRAKIVGDISIVVCQLCVKKTDMEKQRCGAHLNQHTQAENMLSSSDKRFKPANIGDNVAIPIPAVVYRHKRREEFPNVLGVITSVSGDGIYKIGTSYGTLKQKYTRTGKVIIGYHSFESTKIPATVNMLR